MKEQYKELKEDVLDEQKAIDETIERLLEIKDNFHPQRPEGHGLAPNKPEGDGWASDSPSHSQSQRQDYLTEPAMGTYLMNFYNGIENILKRISKEYYLIIPKGNSWHKELLVLSYSASEGKIAIFDQGIVERIVPYKNFRHRFVSGYGFQLKGEKMLELINDVGPLWGDVKKAISGFFDRL